MFHKFVLISSLLSIMLLTGCGQLAIDGQIVRPGEAAEVRADDGQSPVLGGSPDSIPVSYDGISFAYDTSLADEVIPETVPAQDEEGGPFWAASPQHTKFSFEGYVLPDTLHAPQILVYPVEAYEAISPAAAKTIADLRYFMATKPSTAPEPGFGSDGIPALPLFNAAQMMAAGMEYIDFQNGSGVRFLTQYAQAYIPINNHELFYSFQGLTDDGAYYVAAILPVSHLSLPDEMAPMGEEEFTSYLSSTVTSLNAQANASFTPDLALLDAMIRSLSVQ